MVKFTFDKADYFSKLMNAVSALVADATVIFRLGYGAEKPKPEMTIRAFDPSHIALVDFTLSAFDSFDIASNVVEERLGLNLPNLLKVLKRAKSGEKLEFSFDNENKKVSIKLTSDSGKRLFILPTQNPDPTVMGGLPSTKTTTTITMTPSALLEKIEDAETVSDNVVVSVDSTFKVAPGEANTPVAKPTALLSFFGKGDLTQALLEMETNREGAPTVESEAEGITRATYNIEYLLGILRNASGVSDKVRVEFGTNLPMRLTFGVTNGSLLYLLAPRIEKESGVEA